MPVSRRRFTRLIFLGALGAASVGGGAAMLNYLYPRNARKSGGPETLSVRARDVPVPGGAPLLNEDYGFYLVNVADENALYGGTGITSGLLALSTVCPHIAGECPVRWNPEFQFQSPFTTERVTGWMVCPCHGSVFTRAGVRVFGPARHSLDTLRIDEKNGGLIVHLTDSTESGVDSGVEPLPWP